MNKHTLMLLFLVASCILAGGPALAQEVRYQSPGHDHGLSIGLTLDELKLMHLIGVNHRATSPPTGPVRAAAEWDESQGVFCLWDNSDLMRELQEDNDLYIITTSSDKSWWQSWLNSNGIPQTRVKWLIAYTNTWWVRDYGPWFVWDGNNDFGLVDTIYNRPRPSDDAIPGKISTAYGIPLYAPDLEHTGGNYYADGYGNAWSSTLVYSENPGMSEAQVNQKMADYLGIDRYITRDLKIDIEHIDTFGKPLAPDVLVWSDFPQGKDHRGWSEAAHKYYKTLASPYDRPYKIHRMPLWNYSYSMTAYINSLQTQNKIIIPKYNTGNDNTAVSIYEDAAPGYEVVKVSSGGTYWGDSVHCRTRNFVRGDGVRIYAYPPADSEDTVYGYDVRAEIYTDNSTSLDGNPAIYYSTTGGAPFSSVPMYTTGNPDEYVGTIPAQSWGSTVSYYVFAQDLLGNDRTHPPVAPDGLHSFDVAQDLTPPDMDHDVVHGAAVGDWPITFRARVTDNTCLPDVTLQYSVDGVNQPAVTMTRVPGTFLYEGVPTAPVSTGDRIEYRIVATDSSAAQNQTVSPYENSNVFYIASHNAVCVIDLDQTPFSGDDWVDMCCSFGLSWEFTDSWPSSLSGYDAVIICLGMSPHNKQLSTSQANALVSFLNAGGAAYMEGGNCFAQDSARTIYRPYFGLSTASSGSTLSGTLSGVSGTPTDGMSFSYNGDPGSCDHLTPSGATAVIKNGSYNKTVVYDTGTYATVGSSFEFCGLVDGSDPSRAKKLAAFYLDHLGFGIDLVVHGTGDIGGNVTLDVKGDPGDTYIAAYSFGPNHKNLASGTLLISNDSLNKLPLRTIPSSGEDSRTLSIPNNTNLIGREVYFQARVNPSGGGAKYLTNRDMFTVVE